MAENHPACNTPLVRKLRKHFKHNPSRWKEVYTNLKIVHDRMNVNFYVPDLTLAFSWRLTLQGYNYWFDIQQESLLFRID